MTLETMTIAHSWTVAEVRALRPCSGYDEARLTALWAGRERLAIPDVCDLEIPEVDRLWLLCRAPWPVIAPAITKIVERAVRRYALPHPSTRAWAERWLSGEDRSLSEAEAAAAAAEAEAWAAWAAARAAQAAAWEAAAWAAGEARAAAGEAEAWAEAWAARAAAWEAAAWAAAWEAAAWAARAAAWEAAAAETERKFQIADFRTLEGGGE